MMVAVRGHDELSIVCRSSADCLNCSVSAAAHPSMGRIFPRKETLCKPAIAAICIRPTTLGYRPGAMVMIFPSETIVPVLM